MQSGKDGNSGFAGLASIVNKTYYAYTKNQNFLKSGVPVNVAFSWGKDGLLVYVDGESLKNGLFQKADQSLRCPQKRLPASAGKLFDNL